MTNTISFKEMKLKFKNKKSIFNTLILIYIYILFVLPNDMFQATSIDILHKSASMYYDAWIINVSILYLPIVLCGFFKIFKYKISRFLLWVLVYATCKDILIYLLGNNHYFQYDLYYTYLVSLCLFAIIADLFNDKDNIHKFIKIFTIIHLLTLLVSVVTGIGTGLYGFEKRYHSSGLSSGENAYIFALLSCYFAFMQKKKNYLLFFLCILGIVATGTRKELLYLVIIFLIFIFNEVFRKKTYYMKKLNTIHLFLILSFIIVIPILLISDNNIFSKLDISRYADVLTSIFSDGISSLLTDSSAIGRIGSIKAGISVLKTSPLIGTYFSFFDVQYYMQLFNYPTFPHSTFLFYACCLGIPICIFILYYLISLLYKAFLLRNPCFYALLYFLIHNIISGGALIDIKVVFFNIYYIYMIKKILKLND